MRAYITLILMVFAVAGCNDRPDLQMMDYKAYRHGPHVILNEDEATALYFIEEDTNWSAQEVEIPRRGLVQVLVENPLFAPFPVSVNRNPDPVPSVFSPADNILVIADIEGNFTAMYALLVRHKVIDAEGNWTYGNGHLVMLGDLFDRGPDVTPVLWLLYKLESEAQQAGGVVHVLLGNHELMIFGGDTRYIHPKYRKQGADTDIRYADLYSARSTLGYWMRSKPSVIRIGTNLFSHAGISPDVLDLDLDLDMMNALVRKYNLGQTDSLTTEQRTILGKNGIFWYRGWVDEPPSADVLDAVLNRYQAALMVIGHTVVPEVLVAYDGKLAMTDLKQPTDLHDAPARALLIKGGQLFEVNSLGEHRPVTNN